MVEVIVDFDRGWLFVKQNGGGAAEGLQVRMVGGKVVKDSLAKVELAAVPLDRRTKPSTCLFSFSN
jgi:starvation-inducible outer membrane lipoprotein